MELATNSKFEVNKNAHFGTAVVFVEGQKDEFKIFPRIFRDLLGYSMVSKSRGNDFYASFMNDASTIVILNTKNSNIGSVLDQNFRNQIFEEVYEKYNLDLTNKPIFYLWDRDRGNNSENVTRRVIGSLGNPYENGDYHSGLILLSYPAFESYVVSIAGLTPSKEIMTTKELKKFLSSNHNFQPSQISLTTLSEAANKMCSKMQDFGITSSSLEDFCDTNEAIFNIKEEEYASDGGYRQLSLISIMLIYLGILVPKK